MRQVKNMHDVLDIVKNIENVFGSNTSFQVLKDFERVLDHLDIYVYANWTEGEVVEGPNIERHWVTCSFMWPEEEMPDPMGGKRLLDYDCKVRYSKSSLVVPRKIEEPNDVRPGTKKGKLDRLPVWVVEIQMPKKLIADIYTGYMDDAFEPPEQTAPPTEETQPADDMTADEDMSGEDMSGEGELDL